MKRSCLLTGIALSLVLSCSEDKSGFWVDIVFPDDDSKARAVSLEISAVIPDIDSSCERLFQNTHSPGDLGYELDDQIVVDMADPTLSRPLEEIGPGLRLFYAQAFDSFPYSWDWNFQLLRLIQGLLSQTESGYLPEDF